MVQRRFRFAEFELDLDDRQLKQAGVPVQLNGRYLDALALLLSEQGRLVSKERFLEVVWRGVPVTDEALTQCIKTLRRQLGDNAASPRFIETVPKHGYRFIGPASVVDVPAGYSLRQFFLLGSAGTTGAGVAGILGGLFFGFAGAGQILQPGMGTVSVLMVIVFLTFVVALLGGAGVSFGIAASGFATRRSWQWTVLGGACGGLLVGTSVKLLGLDTFELLFGQTPGDFTGAVEGMLLGAAVGLGAWLGYRGEGVSTLGRSMTAAALVGASAGILITLSGGRLMGGSLDLLSRNFPDSRLRLDRMGELFGEGDFGPVTQLVTGSLEGALFGSCIVGAMILAQRRLRVGRAGA